MRKRVKVWRRSTGERLPDPLPEGLVKMNPDLTTEKPATQKVEGCCGEGLVDFDDDPEPLPVKKSTSGRKKEKSDGSTS